MYSRVNYTFFQHNILRKSFSKQHSQFPGVSVLYYKQKLGPTDNINHLLYFTLSLFGVLISCGAFLHIFVLIFTLYYDQDTLNILLPTSYILMITSTYTSALINVSLAVVRTINIVTPLQRINRKAAIISISAYWLLTVTVAVVDVAFWKSGYSVGPGYEYYYTFINMSSCYGILALLHTKNLLHPFIVANHKALFPVLIWVIPCVIPSVFCLVSSSIQIFSLRRRKLLRQEDQIHSKVTITILLLTVTFFICNTVNFTYVFLMSYGEWSGYKVFLTLYVVTSMVPFINTLVNPIILVSRGHLLRRFFVGFLKRRRRRLTSGEVLLEMECVQGKDDLKIEHPVTRQETVESFTRTFSR